MAQRTILVTGAGGPLGANVTRSLRAAFSDARLVGTDANRYHLPLSLCDQTYLIPPAKERIAYQAALTVICQQENIQALIPTHPVEVRAIAELRDQGLLPANVGTALPKTSVIEICDDKAKTQARLLAAKVPVPRTISLRKPADVEEAFGLFGGGQWPVWVRGSGAPGLGVGGAALPCREVGVAVSWIEYHKGWGYMSASEFLPGKNLTWMAAFQQGRLLAAATRERLEYVLPHVSPSGITGAPAVTKTLYRNDVSEIGQAAIRAADDSPHGVYFVDLKEDPAGQPRVTEINAGRCGTTIEFYTHAGYNFPQTLAKIACGDTVEKASDPHRVVKEGAYWVRTLDCGPVYLESEEGFDKYPRVNC